MNTYEQKQERRRERYEAKAAAASERASKLWARGHDMASVIPFGQPILVGHHSEGRDRRYRGQINATFRKASAETDKAGHYAAKAASVGTGGISSDDPDAITKLRAQLEKGEEMQALMRDANKVVRRFYKAGVRNAESEGWADYLAALRKIRRGFEESTAAALLQPDFAGRIGFADYQLTNNNANNRRIKARIAELERAAERETVETTHETAAGTVEIVENADENRLQIFFPDKPSPEIRAELKARGFRWARSAGAWQRQLNNGARYAAECVLRAIG